MEMLFDIRHQIPQAFTRMIAGAQVMHITKSALDRGGARTISRQKEQGKAGVLSQPLFDGLCFMDFVVIHHDIDPFELWSRLGFVQRLQQLSEERIGFARPTAVA